MSEVSAARLREFEELERPLKLAFCGCGKGFKTLASYAQHRKATKHASRAALGAGEE